MDILVLLVEDSVTGTGGTWYQSNSYAGGGVGSLIDVDGTDWSTLPNWVPDVQMIYRHVNRNSTLFQWWKSTSIFL